MAGLEMTVLLHLQSSDLSASPHKPGVASFIFVHARQTLYHLGNEDTLLTTKCLSLSIYDFR